MSLHERAWCAPLFALSLACAASPAVAEDPPAHASPPLRCRAFQVDPAAPELDTTDTNTDAGRWTSDRESEGWVLFNVDFELGQKATGYPSAWWEVCLYRPA